MSNAKKVTIKDFCRKTGQLVELDVKDFAPLPPPYDQMGLEPQIKPMSDEAKQKYESDLDGVSAYKFPRPETEEEKRELVEKFLSGLKKLFAMPVVHILVFGENKPRNRLLNQRGPFDAQ